MSGRPVTNMAASIHQRLLDAARRTRRPFGDLVQHYALERWLYRLSRSEFNDRFVLKGALLLVAWDAPVTRPTRDVDLLGYLRNDLDDVRRGIAKICQVPVEDDGLVFDPASVVTERIAVDADYEGVRARFRGRLGTTRIAMQADIGFGDLVTPGPMSVSFPTMLGQPAPQLQAYNRETAVAEKLEAMVKLGELNSRLKDFFDVWLLARHFDFDGAALVAAVSATFRQRGTTMATTPACLRESFASDPAKAVQWRAFLRRAEIPDAPPEFVAVAQFVRVFLMAPALAVAEQLEFARHWPAGGPWQPGS